MLFLSQIALPGDIYVYFSPDFDILLKSIDI